MMAINYKIVKAKNMKVLCGESKDGIERLVRDVESKIISAAKKGESSVDIKEGNWFGAFRPNEYAVVTNLLEENGYTLKKASGTSFDNKDFYVNISWAD